SRRMTADAYCQLRGAPAYRPELDVIVIAPAGEVAAFVMGWYDAENHVAEFEPVGTAPDFWRRGRARAAVLEALQRVKALGARETIVYADGANPAAQALYRGVGFHDINRIFAYRKPIDRR